jgi:[citrate (pro-3S)-lyase] ligase
MDYMFSEYKKEYIDRYNSLGRLQTNSFLKSINIEYDENIDITINLIKNDTIIASASAEKNLIKCIGANPEFRSEGLLNTLFSDLVAYKYNQEIYNLSLFTKAEYEKLISSLGFYTICKTENIVFMENHNHKFEEYLENLPKFKSDGSIGAIVMNLNPITNGHLYLIEKAASENDLLYIFVVSEDQSVVPFETRYRLALESTKHLKNVVLIKGGDYIISSTTFPSYFSKNYNHWINNYCELDLTIFSKYIAKKLNISKRYVGTEPYCQLTNYYNQKMSEILPHYGIDFILIERLFSENGAISASQVRKLADEGDFKTLKALVPEATYNYLISKKNGGLNES